MYNERPGPLFGSWHWWWCTGLGSMGGMIYDFIIEESTGRAGSPQKFTTLFPEGRVGAACEPRPWRVSFYDFIIAKHDD